MAELELDTIKLHTILSVLFNYHDGTRAALSNRGASAAAIFPVFGNIHTGPPESKIMLFL